MALSAAGIRAVLTGGACASLYSRGRYESSDLDFIIQGTVSVEQLDAAMASIEYRRVGNQYEHARAPYFVEFPAGPLAIGRDFRIQPVEFKVRRADVLALSATDSCRDRLAAFYHWNDRQALKTAVSIARLHKVDLASIRKWSAEEGAHESLGTFLDALKEGPRRARSRTR
jgi:hypothetical protein